MLSSLSAVALALLLAAPAGETPAMTGFTSESAARERDVEAAFEAIPDPERVKRWHRLFTAEPHPAGTERNNELAFEIAREWVRQGLEQVSVHRYDVLNTAPKQVELEMVAPVRFQASLREAPYAVDPDTANSAVSGAYSGMSASGEVTAPLVYAHSGNPEDYEVLRKNGIDVKGKIVLVRYSNPYSYRGFKALTAQREGAAAILIYSDPAEDGYVKGKTFPDGPWGPESHIQRGAITYDFLVPGDPLTPGWPSLADAKRVKPEEARSLPKIMCLPLSWKDAKPLLEQIGGPPAPKDWQGGLKLQYRLGGERARIHLKIEMDNAVRPNYVVEGRIRGAERPDEWVVLGNHRDAWVFGGVDPSSGTASMMELTRALGELLRKGIRPRRTLVVCSWDGEEVGLTGSTEWGEDFADELTKKGVAYLNVDSSASGPNFEGSAVGSLAPLLVEVSRSLEDPSGVSLHDAWKASRERREGKAVADDALVDTRIGSGSDHTVFLNHLGVPTMELSFEGPYGVYHSVYDDYYWINHFGDPGYRYHTLMSRLWGVLGLRLANADLLPFDFVSYARNIRAFLGELPGEPPVDLGGVRKALAGFEASGRYLGQVEAQALQEGGGDAHLLSRTNDGILRVERNWLNPDGIPGRPWFKHLLYAARYTYAHLELPGLTEALEARDADRARAQAALLEEALQRNAALVYGLAEELRRGSSPPAAAPPPLAGLEATLAEMRRDFPGDMAVYMKNLATGDEIDLDADSVYETFSVIKIPIMVEVLKQVAAGRFSLDDRVPIKLGDRRIPSGVLYALDPGLQPTVRDLLKLMIILSDNEATDLLADKVGRQNVTDTMQQMGLTHTSIRYSDLDWDRHWLGSLDPSFREATGDETLKFPFDKYTGAQVSEAFGHTIWDAGIYFGHSSAREIGRLLEKIEAGEVVSKAACDQMLGILKQQQVDDRFPRYLRDVEIAHKTGDGQPFIANDVGILWVKDQPIVLVVFTGHHRGDTAALTDAVARVAAVVGRHYGAALSPAFDR